MRLKFACGGEDRKGLDEDTPNPSINIKHSDEEKQKDKDHDGVHKSGGIIGEEPAPSSQNPNPCNIPRFVRIHLLLHSETNNKKQETETDEDREIACKCVWLVVLLLVITGLGVVAFCLAVTPTPASINHKTVLVRVHVVERSGGERIVLQRVRIDTYTQVEETQQLSFHPNITNTLLRHHQHNFSLILHQDKCFLLHPQQPQQPQQPQPQQPTLPSPQESTDLATHNETPTINGSKEANLGEKSSGGVIEQYVKEKDVLQGNFRVDGPALTSRELGQLNSTLVNRHCLHRPTYTLRPSHPNKGNHKRRKTITRITRVTFVCEFLNGHYRLLRYHIQMCVQNKTHN